MSEQPAPQSKLELPATKIEPGAEAAFTPEAASKPEQSLSAPALSLPGANPSPDPVAAQPAPDPSTTSTAAPVTDDGTNPDIAADVDVLEKEWVKKAKEIVDATKSDPRKQKTELSKFKADYMKKRYDKDIRLEE